MIDTIRHLTNQWSDAPAGSTCRAAGEEMASVVERHKSLAATSFLWGIQVEVPSFFFYKNIFC